MNLAVSLVGHFAGQVLQVSVQNGEVRLYEPLVLHRQVQNLDVEDLLAEEGFFVELELVYQCEDWEELRLQVDFQLAQRLLTVSEYLGDEPELRNGVQEELVLHFLAVTFETFDELVNQRVRLLRLVHVDHDRLHVALLELQKRNGLLLAQQQLDVLLGLLIQTAVLQHLLQLLDLLLGQLLHLLLLGRRAALNRGLPFFLLSLSLFRTALSHSRFGPVLAPLNPNFILHISFRIFVQVEYVRRALLNHLVRVVLRTVLHSPER